MPTWSWCKDLKKITQEFEKNRKQLENHKSLNNVLEKHKKTKSKRTMCLKNENTKKQNETLKASNGIGIEFLQKNSIWFQLSIGLGIEP